jgi:hypothetical protein
VSCPRVSGLIDILVRRRPPSVQGKLTGLPVIAFYRTRHALWRAADEDRAQRWLRRDS